MKITHMERKRSGLVPIGKAFGGLGGPVKAIPAASPQVRHHFTQADQVDQLVSGREVDRAGDLQGPLPELPDHRSDRDGHRRMPAVRRQAAD